ncbi:hypothetical protein FN846DRAFT_904075 [Sphaerosporella brunnea]|uniref:Uncharacterized protein n=1 Tax=Sphaerosporella brunnea TaxID=1250544 RepID=A0A5J5F5G9_9PEZI|nr:hypothetical protein FN846DRAFT_904075 [Sphaerosporella brunnea]
MFFDPKTVLAALDLNKPRPSFLLPLPHQIIINTAPSEYHEAKGLPAFELHTTFYSDIDGDHPTIDEIIIADMVIESSNDQKTAPSIDVNGGFVNENISFPSDQTVSIAIGTGTIDHSRVGSTIAEIQTFQGHPFSPSFSSETREGGDIATAQPQLIFPGGKKPRPPVASRILSNAIYTSGTAPILGNTIGSRDAVTDCPEEHIRPSVSKNTGFSHANITPAYEQRISAPVEHQFIISNNQKRTTFVCHNITPTLDCTSSESRQDGIDGKLNCCSNNRNTPAADTETLKLNPCFTTCGHQYYDAKHGTKVHRKLILNSGSLSGEFSIASSSAADTGHSAQQSDRSRQNTSNLVNANHSNESLIDFAAARDTRSRDKYSSTTVAETVPAFQSSAVPLVSPPAIVSVKDHSNIPRPSFRHSKPRKYTKYDSSSSFHHTAIANTTPASQYIPTQRPNSLFDIILSIICPTRIPQPSFHNHTRRAHTTAETALGLISPKRAAVALDVLNGTSFDELKIEDVVMQRQAPDIDTERTAEHEHAGHSSTAPSITSDGKSIPTDHGWISTRRVSRSSSLPLPLRILSDSMRSNVSESKPPLLKAPQACSIQEPARSAENWGKPTLASTLRKGEA